MLLVAGLDEKSARQITDEEGAWTAKPAALGARIIVLPNVADAVRAEAALSRARR
jgi:hypothetical protein